KKPSWLDSLKRGAQDPAGTHLGVEQLEARLVPTTTPAVDLTTHGSYGEVGDGLFRQYDAQPTGTGVIQSFVRLQGRGNQAVTQGYNTDHRPVQFDENTSPQFTRLL